MKDLIVRKKSKFGTDHYFPYNDNAKLLIEIIPRREAFFKKDLIRLKDLGFRIVVKAEEI
jgi:hypothetical protein